MAQIQEVLSHLLSNLHDHVTPTHILIAIPSVLLTYYILSAIYTRYYHLREFDGPFFASFSYAWLARVVLSGQMGDRLTETNRRYSKHNTTTTTVRVGPNDLLTMDPDVIRRCSAARSRYVRSNWYAMGRLDPWDDNLFSHMDTGLHDKLKAKMAAGYAGKENPGLEDDIEEVIGFMISRIRERYAVGGGGTGEKKVEKPLLDFGHMAQYMTLDVITKVAFGSEFGFLEQEKDLHGYIAMIEQIAPPSVLCSGVPYLSDFFAQPWVIRLLSPKAGDSRGFGKMMGVAKEIVDARYGGNKEEKQDMMASFMRHGLTRRQVETEAIFQIVAGSDTTATAIRATVLHVVTCPRVYNALQREIDEAISQNKISTPAKAAEGAALPYLQAVISEGLRIHPPFNGIPSKVVPPEGDYIDGKFVPGGTRILPCFGGLGRNKTVFGEDADVFRPERFLEAQREDPERAAEMRRVAEMAFGYGRFACAGKPVAMLELNKVFVEVSFAYCSLCVLVKEREVVVVPLNLAVLSQQRLLTIWTHTTIAVVPAL